MYKIICKREKCLTSSTVTGQAAIEYKVNKYIKAPKWLAKKGYHPTLFKQKKDALDFFKQFNALSLPAQLWQVKARKIIKSLPPMLNYCFIGNRKCIYCNRSWPVGTIMAEKVMLIKQIL